MSFERAPTRSKYRAAEPLKDFISFNVTLSCYRILGRNVELIRLIKIVPVVGGNPCPTNARESHTISPLHVSRYSNCSS